MSRDTALSPSNFVLPLFLQEGERQKTPIQ
ncbi:MAG: Delta-aminolevulinic acid dehydratase, partial [Polyangiaceae bacterium]|nr:Delta-aminolevulinic acid dehydratase [Polyangiaceae bacterium]